MPNIASATESRLNAALYPRGGAKLEVTFYPGDKNVDHALVRHNELMAITGEWNAEQHAEFKKVSDYLNLMIVAKVALAHEQQRKEAYAIYTNIPFPKGKVEP